MRTEFGLAPGAEVTTEANPDSVDERMLDELRAGGYTRISFGMQSTSTSVAPQSSTARTLPARASRLRERLHERASST